MRRFLIWIIKKYQKLPISSHGLCKFQPTCSEYGIIAIERFGSIKGSYLSIKRILRCNPFNKGGIDNVPTKEKKQ